MKKFILSSLFIWPLLIPQAAVAQEQKNVETAPKDSSDKYKEIVECELYRKQVTRYPNESDWIDKNTKDFQYPQNDGFFPGSEVSYILKKGMLISRYGSPGGRFAAPEGALWQERALAPGSSSVLYVYQLETDIPVQEGLVSPWFNESGCGVQYKFSEPIADLLRKNALKLVQTKLEYPPRNTNQ